MAKLSVTIPDETAPILVRALCRRSGLEEGVENAKLAHAELLKTLIDEQVRVDAAKAALSNPPNMEVTVK